MSDVVLKKFTKFIFMLMVPHYTVHLKIFFNFIF